jgi:hypothetical protein
VLEHYFFFNNDVLPTWQIFQLYEQSKRFSVL